MGFADFFKKLFGGEEKTDAPAEEARPMESAMTESEEPTEGQATKMEDTMEESVADESNNEQPMA